MLNDNVQRILIPDLCPQCGWSTCVQLDQQEQPRSATVHCGRVHVEGAASPCHWGEPIAEFDANAPAHMFVVMADEPWPM